MGSGQMLYRPSVKFQNNRLFPSIWNKDQNYFFYRVQVMKGRLVGEFSDGRRTLKRIDLEKSIASKRR